MKVVVRGLLTVLIVVVSVGLAGVTPAVAQEGIVSCVPTVWQLTAGQTIPVGAVIVTNDRENIYVRYLLDNQAPTACFGTLHLWGGTNLADVPSNPQGVPVPGQYPYSFDASGLRDYTFTIPIADRLEPACNAALSLYIVSHAEVDLDCDPATTGDQETAFGGDQAGGMGVAGGSMEIIRFAAHPHQNPQYPSVQRRPHGVVLLRVQDRPGGTTMIILSRTRSLSMLVSI